MIDQERREALRWVREAQKEGGPIGLMKALHGQDDRLEYVLDYDRDDVFRVLDQVLETVTARERFIIERRYALNTANIPPMTYEAVGRDVGLTRERIRQLEVNALSKLRHPSRLLRLDAYLLRNNEV
jgi:RNA polymerase sigma factor (sigma-70 family)